MVSRRWTLLLATFATTFDLRPAQAQEEVPTTLDPALRVRLWMALLAILLLGLLLLVIIRLGAFSVKRRLRAGRGPSRIGPKYWAARRWIRREPTPPPDADQPSTDSGGSPCP